MLQLPANLNSRVCVCVVVVVGGGGVGSGVDGRCGEGVTMCESIVDSRHWAPC